MNVMDLKQKIIDNPDEYITKILENIHCAKIKSYQNEVRCTDNKHSTNGGIRISKNTLHTKSYYDNWQGDIITLVQKMSDCSFKSAISDICKWLNISEKITNDEIIMPFGGYYKGIKIDKNTDDELITYDEGILDRFLNIPNARFLKDGISLEAQLKYDIRYDLNTDRIVLVWRNLNNEIVGATGRYNGSSQEIKDRDIPKYFPLINFSKSKVLYGLNVNYNTILQQKVIMVGEAEKFCGQLSTMGLNVGVAVGSHNISDYQIKLLHSMFPEKIIVCFDEGIMQDELIETCKKLVYQNSFYRCKIGYIWDKDNIYLKRDNKESPTDLGLQTLTGLLEDCLYWLET